MEINVHPSHKFDYENLERYCKENIKGFGSKIKSISQFNYGQSNPTFKLTDDNGIEYVLRKKPPGKLLPSAHQIEREYKIMKALQNTKVPVPRLYLLSSDINVIGTSFFIMEFIEGRILNPEELLKLNPNEVNDICFEVANVLSALHNVDWKNIQLDNFGKEDNYIERQVNVWTRQYKSSKKEDFEPMEKLMEYLNKNIPQQENRSTIVHGDFKLDNLIFHPTKPIVLAIIDWELSTIGDPLSDLAYNCMVYYNKDGSSVLGGGYPTNMSGTGIPSEKEFIERYVQSTNFKLNNWYYYVSFAFFRISSIAFGVYARALQGNASSTKAILTVEYAKLFAVLAWEIIEKNKDNNSIISVNRISSEENTPPKYNHQIQSILDDNTSIFRLSPKAKELFKKFVIFMEKHVYPNEYLFNSPPKDEKDKWVDYHPIVNELKKKAKEQGLWNLFLPDVGGLTNVEYAHFCEQMGRVALSPTIFNCQAPDTGNMEILHLFGTEQQKKQWLEPLLEGEIHSCFAMTEPLVASSDARNIQLSIKPDGNDYVLNGRKWFISGAGHSKCKISIVMGKTDENQDDYNQQSMVLVPMDTPGITVVRAMSVFGYDDAPHGHMEMIYKNVRVPKSNVLWKEGKGFAIAQARLGPGRIHHCMRSLGVAERALELMIQRSLNRNAFGKRLAKFDTIQRDVSTSRIEIESSRLLVLKTAHLIDTVGAKGARDYISMIKILAVDTTCKVIDRAIQVYGAMGVSQDTILAMAYSWNRSLKIADGPDSVHHSLIARFEFKKHVSKL